MTTAIYLPDVPVRPGAAHVDAWEAGDTRYFRGPLHHIGDGDDAIEIFFDGTQESDGSATRGVNLIEGGYERLNDVSADRARRVGEALIAAADEADAAKGTNPQP